MTENQNEIITPSETNQNGNFAASIWSDGEAFKTAQRMAMALSESNVVPAAYQKNVGNCLIALDMANRLHTGPLMIMQNLYIVHGNPAWSSQYIIAMINNSKRYKTELQFEMNGSGESLSCKAFAFTYDDRKVEGPLITMELANKEGWVSKNGSKWKTMPEVMIRYRAASFFGRLNCPDLIMGMYSADEVREGAFQDPKDITGSAVEQSTPQIEQAKSIDDLLDNKAEIADSKVETVDDDSVFDEDTVLDPAELAKEIDEDAGKDPSNLFEHPAK